MTILKNEIRRLVSEYRDRHKVIETVLASELAQLRQSVNQILPILDEITASASHEVIRVIVKESWGGFTAAVLITLGSVMLIGECSNSADTTAIGEGGFWYFYPCYSIYGVENWSFNDRKHGHIWFSSIEELFAHLIPRVAEELAIYEHQNT